MTEVIFIKIRKLEGLLDEVFLKLLFYRVDVRGNLKDASVDKVRTEDDW